MIFSRNYFFPKIFSGRVDCISYNRSQQIKLRVQKAFSFLLIFFIIFYPDKPSSGHVQFSFENTSKNFGEFHKFLLKIQKSFKRLQVFQSNLTELSFGHVQSRFNQTSDIFFGQSHKQDSFNCDFSKFIIPQNFLPHTGKAVLTKVLGNFRSGSRTNKNFIKKMQRKMLLRTC